MRPEPSATGFTLVELLLAAALGVALDLFETGIKVVDLLTSYR